MDFNNKETSIETTQNRVRVFNMGDFYRGGQSQVILGDSKRKLVCFFKFGVAFTSQGSFIDVKLESIKDHLLKLLKQMGLNDVNLY
ncbi:MAG: hypothetical protein E7192_03145 [Erysipelotrichaceae bacterium]|nr:hypothetical protein [Erysipelotrichaceae bacterium]